MNVEQFTERDIYQEHPLAVEFGVVVALLVAIEVWLILLGRAAPIETLFDMLPPVFGLLYVLTGAELLGLIPFALAYVRLRDVSVHTAIPEQEDARYAALSVAVPALVVAAFAALAVLRGTPIGDMYLKWVSNRVAPGSYAVQTLVEAVVGGLGAALLYQGAVHGTFRRVTTVRHAIALTAVLAGVFTVQAGAGTAAASVLTAVVAAVASLAYERTESLWLPALAFAVAEAAINVVIYLDPSGVPA